jgi:L-ascorbate metabolism protein UlaG (beta-lactamase superfamily)
MLVISQRGLRLIASVLSGLLVSVAAAQELAGDRIPTATGDLIVHPINHATFVMGWNGKSIYVDPVGGGARFAGLPTPDLVLITDIHPDHLDIDTLQAVAGDDTWIVAPAAVAEQLPAQLKNNTTVLANGEATSTLGVSVEAIPMYNLTAERLQYHPKGRGNGYVVTLGGKRVYISGDTEDIPEMRSLQDIDVAFVCFNLPYTMTEEQAASAVRAFRPKIVYPYHYRGSDVDAFVRDVGDASEVRVRDWY